MSTVHYVPVATPGTLDRRAVCGVWCAIGGGHSGMMPIGTSDRARVSCGECLRLSKQTDLFAPKVVDRK